MFPQWAIDKYGIEKCKRAGELAFKGGGTNSTPRIHTPPEFRDLLLAIARSANKASNAGVKAAAEGSPATEGSEP